MTVRTKPVPGNAPPAHVNGADAGTDRSSPFSWEDWFHHAGLQERARALGLAQQQGVLYPHQLPAIRNGVKPTAKEPEPSPRIMRLLAGKADDLSPLQPTPLAIFDADLDDLQRHTVARAMCSPDLFLLQGLPGTGKSRVVAEIVLQAATRGWRVLFLAGQTASLDVVLHRLIDRPEIFALRCLDTQEKPETLPPWLRGLTLDEQKRSFVERTLAGAQGSHEQAESACRRRRDEEPLWSDLERCAERISDLERQRSVMQEQLPRLVEAIEHEADAPQAESPLSNRVAELRQSHDERLRSLEAQLHGERNALERCTQEGDQLAGRIAELEPGYLAKKHGRFWTLSYWAHWFNGAIVPEMEAATAQHARAVAEREAIKKRVDDLGEEQQRIRNQFKEERRRQIDSEVELRRKELDEQGKLLDDDLRRLDDEWNALCRQFAACPAARTPEAIASARQTWQKQRQADEQQCQFTQQWAKFVEETGASMAVKLPSFANVIAGSLHRWQSDAKTREAAGTFDLVIVEDAETLTEAELTKLSRQAPRCVLVAQALAEPTPAPTVAEKASRALLPAPLVSAVCWGKLWQTLGGDAERWPCTWHREQGRLVCQLQPLDAEDRQHLESEGLADAPDIELRILHRPTTRPCLAQVRFGPSCSFADAFHFMVREVQEFPLEPVGRTGWWSEDAQRHCRHHAPNTPRIHAWVDLEDGVRLGTVANAHGDATQAACLEFDKSAGFDRAKAEAWLQRHRPAGDHERAVFLQTPYRFEHSIAKLADAVIRAGDWLVAPAGEPASPGCLKSFEFVAVPPFVKNEWPREGAGLELDLSAARHADRLPVGLRQGLPARGFVNYLEAQALTRRLEAWSQKEASPTCKVAVLALFEGQVELLRRLIEQSEILRGRNFPLEVALPSRLHQCECDVVFLSMTRSHAHRAAAFGEDVKELPLALTRPRARLLMFGDPGALSKRTTWHGPLDQFDAASAQQELVRLSRLLNYLQAQVHPTPPANGVA